MNSLENYWAIEILVDAQKKKKGQTRYQLSRISISCDGHQ